MKRRLFGAGRRSKPQAGRLRRLLKSVNVVEQDLAPYDGEYLSRALHIRVMPEERDRLREMAKFFGITQTQIMRMFILVGMREHGARLDAARDLGYELA